MQEYTVLKPMTDPNTLQPCGVPGTVKLSAAQAKYLLLQGKIAPVGQPKTKTKRQED